MTKTLFGILFIFAIILLIFLRFNASKPNFKDGQKVRITTTVFEEPVRYDTSQYLKIYGLKTYLPLYPEIYYGDKIIVEGIVSGNFLKGKLEKAKLINLEKSKGVLYQLRRRIISFYKKSLPEPHASLIAGVTIGSKSGIPADFWNNLKLSGTAHVVVASGMNVSLVGGFLLSFLLNFLSRKKAIVVTLTGIWIYALLVGFEAPIMRAAIMGSVLFSSQLFGRLGMSIRSLFISAVLMLLIKPIWILDLGFWLSFVATTSLILFQKRVDSVLKFVPGVLRDGLSTSLSAQIGVFPILYFTFGYFNVFSPIINALVLWTIAPITIIGMISGIVGIIIPWLGSIILWLAYPLTCWFNLVVSVGSGLWL